MKAIVFPLRKAVRFSIVVLLCATAQGCSSCGKESDVDPTTTASSFEIAPGHLEPAWTWQDGDARPFAVPSGCRLKSTPRHHARQTHDLFFLAVADDITTFAVATGKPEPEAVTSTRGLVDLGNDPAKASRDIPWLHLADPPIMAASQDGWIALLPEQDAFGPKVKVWLWREGGKLDVLAEGDRLDAIDARCDKRQCVVLTTLAANVATRGASLWMGDPGQPTTSMKRVDIPADLVLEGASPMRIAAWDAKTRSATIAFDAPQNVQFFQAIDASVKEIGKVARGAAVLDSIATQDANIAVMTRGEPDNDGCVGEGAKIEIAVANRSSSFLPSHALANSGYARRLGQGAFVTWIASTNCRAPERKVVYGVLLGKDGTPTSSAMAIGDADGHAVSTEGNDVHLWLRGPKGVTWLQARCSFEP